MVGLAVAVVVSSPRSTGSLIWLRVRKRPEEGSVLTIRSLKEFVPISTAAKRLLFVVVAGVGGGKLDDIFFTWKLLCTYLALFSKKFYKINN